MNIRTNLPSFTAIGLSAVLLTAPLASASAQEPSSAQGSAPPSGAMGGMQPTNPGMMPMGGPGARGGMMGPEMMQQRQAMMQQHMSKMEGYMANIEALLRELVELTKANQ
jgi:hypothetical protein